MKSTSNSNEKYGTYYQQSSENQHSEPQHYNNFSNEIRLDYGDFHEISEFDSKESCYSKNFFFIIIVSNFESKYKTQFLTDYEREKEIELQK